MAVHELLGMDGWGGEKMEGQDLEVGSSWQLTVKGFAEVSLGQAPADFAVSSHVWRRHVWYSPGEPRAPESSPLSGAHCDLLHQGFNVPD